MTSDHRLKVGIDFGTTFSGVAWTHTAEPDEVNVIMEWPGGARKSEKVPSEITYKATGEVDKWGFGIKPGEERLAWVKLLLDSTRYGTNGAESTSSMLSRTLNLMPGQSGPTEKQPVDVVADYLRCLRMHTIKTLNRSYGKAFVDATPIDYTLTVPAIWTDVSKESTLRAAEAAGFGTTTSIQLMSEPDAAAAWTLLRDIKPNKLKVHDAFVVVDCGGGTVDLISYEVEKMSPKFTVRECAKGTGALCGSSFLNQGFEDLVRSRVGARFNDLKPAARNRMLREFEEVLKRSFSNDEDEDIFTCSIGGLADDPVAGIEDGGLILTREDMQSIFDPVINQIIPLVQEQIDMILAQNEKNLNISAVLLVGGFGASKYLFQRLQDDLRETLAFKMSPFEILQPVNSWSAVARGAALGICISSRRARKHYGTLFWDWFRHGKHPITNITHCTYTGRARCKDCMRWFIKQGAEVSEDKPITFPFFRMVPLSGNMKFTDDLYESAEAKAPEYLNQAGVAAPRKLCTIVSDLGAVSRDLFSKKTGANGNPYYEVHYKLVMSVNSAVLGFHLEFQGQRYGTVSVEYSHN